MSSSPSYAPATAPARNQNMSRYTDLGHDVVPPKVGFGRRNLFLKHQADTLTHHESAVRALRRQLDVRTRERDAAQQRIQDMERAHDGRNAEAEALRRIGEAMGQLFDLEEMLRA